MLASYQIRTSIAAWDHKWVRRYSILILQSIVNGIELFRSALYDIEIRMQD